MIYWKRLLQTRAWKKIILCLALTAWAIMLMAMALSDAMEGMETYSNSALYSMPGYAFLANGSFIGIMILGMLRKQVLRILKVH